MSPLVALDAALWDSIVGLLDLPDYVRLASSCKELWSRQMALVEIFGTQSEERSRQRKAFVVRRSQGAEVINICPCGMRPAHLQAFVADDVRPRNLAQLILKACPACAWLQQPEADEQQVFVESVAVLAAHSGANTRALGISGIWAPCALPGRLAALFTNLQHLNIEIQGHHMLEGLGELCTLKQLKSLQIHLLTEDPCEFDFAASESLEDLRIVRNPPSSLRVRQHCRVHLGFTYTVMPSLFCAPGQVPKLTSLLLCLLEPLSSDPNTLPDIFRQPTRVKYLTIFSSHPIGTADECFCITREMCPLLAQASIVSLECPCMHLSVPANAGVCWTELKLRACDASGCAGAVGLHVSDPSTVLDSLEVCEVMCAQVSCSNLCGLSDALLSRGRIFVPAPGAQDPLCSKVRMLCQGEGSKGEEGWEGCDFHCMACRWCLKAMGKLRFSSQFMGHIV